MVTTFTKGEKKVYNNIVKNKFSKYTKDDFEKVTRASGTYWVLKDTSEFVSEYQTRVYDTKFSFIFNKPNPKYTLEYISEGLKYYFKQPDLLKNKDKELYEFIEKAVK